MFRTILLASALTVALGSNAFAAASSATTNLGNAVATGQAATNPNTPGATGRTIVIGDNSTIAGDAEATRMRQTGSYGGSGD